MKTIDGRARLGSALRPDFDRLEAREMLSVAGDLAPWTRDGRITYSFAPDGTSIGGIPSRLDQSLGAGGLSTDEWQEQFRGVVALWGAATGIRFVQVPDDGSPFGSPPLGDAGSGDVRIGGIGLTGNELGLTFLPSEHDPGTLSGDIIFNVNQPFADIERTFAFEPDAVGDPDASATPLGGRFDFMTVALHESGHVLGLRDIQHADAVMGEEYHGVERMLEPGDIALLSRSRAVPHPQVLQPRATPYSRGVRLGPGDSATLAIRVDIQGFYALDVAAQDGGVAITRTGPGGLTSSLPVGETVMYLAPGEYRFHLAAAGPGVARLRLGFSAPAVDHELLLSNGVGQDPAFTPRLLTSTSSPSGSGPSPLVPATSTGMPPGVPPPISAASTSPAGLAWTTVGGLVGRPTSPSDHVTAVGPAVGAGKIGLAYNGRGLPPGIDLGTVAESTPRERSIAATFSGPGAAVLGADGLLEGGGGRADEVALAAAEWLVTPGVGRATPDPGGSRLPVAAMQDPGAGADEDEAGAAGLASPAVTLAAVASLVIGCRQRLDAWSVRLAAPADRRRGLRAS